MCDLARVFGSVVLAFGLVTGCDCGEGDDTRSEPDAASSADAAPDATADAARDAETSPDSAVDAAVDASVDARADTGSDAASDAEIDAGGQECGPDVVFCEEAEERGLLVDGPAYGRGAAWIDVDGDGWEDLWQSDTGSGHDGHERTSMLYRNLGDATFEAMDLGIDTDDMLRNWTGSWADYDADGDPDLLLVNGGYSREEPCALYRNDLADTGAFTDVSGPAGILELPSRWWSAGFADFDGDSLLDIAVTAIRGPLALYRNEGDGTFQEVAAAVGLTDPVGDTKNPVWFDHDLDGDQDLYVASVTDHHFFRNDGPDGFVDVTEDLLEAIGASSPVFAAAAADFDQDGWEDLYLGRWDSGDRVLVNQGGEGFEMVGEDAGLDAVGHPLGTENTMGMTAGDVDADGWPDALIGPGRPSEAGPPVAFCNDGVRPLHFHRCSDDFVAGHGEARNHGIVLADPDHDGDVDVFWNLGGHVEFDIETGEDTTEMGAFYVNRPRTPARTAVIHLVGAPSNLPAIGARVEVVGSETHYYTIHAMQGFPGQNSDWLPVSLGDSDTGTATITWPSGAVSEVELIVGDRVEIEE
ncbi:MAG: CRTAC1 family protein [Deltaproteobacteria bacterium]|nr:CRTAC1 family protein [Deltaproteobacteria bacterium]